MSNFISAEQLGHSFQDNWLFKGLNLGLNAGQRMALVGVNGAGKSTLMKILSGKIQPQDAVQLILIWSLILLGRLRQSRRRDALKLKLRGNNHRRPS
jgi:ATPase subunit of ABC transporter with duplicated ATPase domains